MPRHGHSSRSFYNKGRTECAMHRHAGHLAQGMWVGTFHGRGHRMLVSHWKEAGCDSFRFLTAMTVRLRQRFISWSAGWGTVGPRFQAQWWINGQKEKACGRGISSGGDVFSDHICYLQGLRAGCAGVAWSFCPNCCCARLNCAGQQPPGEQVSGALRICW